MHVLLDECLEGWMNGLLRRESYPLLKTVKGFLYIIHGAILIHSVYSGSI